MPNERSKKYIIRPARTMDAFHLVQLMKEYLAQLQPQRLELNEADCVLWLMGIINMGGAWVAIADKKIVGSIGCNVDFHPWNRQDRFVLDEWYYVKPEYRKGYSIASELIKIAKSKAHAAGLRFHFSLNSGTDSKADRFVRMLGFTYVGGNLIAFVPPGEENG